MDPIVDELIVLYRWGAAGLFLVFAGLLALRVLTGRGGTPIRRVVRWMIVFYLVVPAAWVVAYLATLALLTG